MELSEILKNIDIIRELKEDAFLPLPTSEIERRLGLSHHPTFRRLKLLESCGIILKSKEGYSLNLKDDTVIEIMKFLSNMEKIKTNVKRA